MRGLVGAIALSAVGIAATCSSPAYNLNDEPAPPRRDKPVTKTPSRFFRRSFSGSIATANRRNCQPHENRREVERNARRNARKSA